MIRHAESRVVPYPADLMYDIVADVERYPEFLPWCIAERVLKRGKENGKEFFRSEMVVGFKAFRERYVSRTDLDPDARTIVVTQADGLFRHLKTDWRFTPEGPEGDETRVDFAIEFEFKSRLLGAVAGQAFAHVMTRMSQAFEERAKALSKSR